MEALLIEQRATISLISNAVANYDKLAMAKRTQVVAEGRLKLLLDRWALCQHLNVKINVAAAAAKMPADEYFTNEEFNLAEKAFEEAHDFLQEKIAAFRPPAPPSANSTVLGHTSTIDVTNSSTMIKLPAIDLPKFSGCYTEWMNYRSMFETLIINHDALSAVQRLHYLKSTLSGEASRLLPHFTVTEANFKDAWDLLTETYEDKRAMIDANFKSFLSLPAMTGENARDMKNIRDKTRDALKALKNLGCLTDSWGEIIVYLTVQKLDASSVRAWEMQLGATSEYPRLKTLTDFLSARIRALEKVSGNNKPVINSNKKPKTSQQTTEVRSHSTTTEGGSVTCLLCEGTHLLYKCEQFKSQTVACRKEITKEKKCCYNCLRPGHLPLACPRKYTCAHCKKKHDSLLHTETNLEATNSSSGAPRGHSSNTNPSVEATSPIVPGSNVTSTHHVQQVPAKGNFTLLATAMVSVRTATGRRLRVRALLDQGSQSTLIKESVVQALRPKRFLANPVVNGVEEIEIGIARHRVNLYVEPRDNTEGSVVISALVLPTLTRYAPRSRVNMGSWEHLKEVALADPQPSSQQPIDLIIGADYYGALLCPGLRQGPTAQATIFGWILSGPVSLHDEYPDAISVHSCSASDDLHAALARFWKVEELPRVTRLSEDEQICEEHFVATHSRAEDGRYIVRLPFKKGAPIDIGESFFRARSMLSTVERRLQRDQSLRKEYHAFLSEYEELGHMRPAPGYTGNGISEARSLCVYLPHHPVVRESSSTTRVRVVFNASSATSNATSFNDHLLVGPKLQTEITTIIMRWRAPRFAYTADIAKMFRQILVDPRDVDYQCILWKREADKVSTHFQLLTVTYGTAPAPFLANRVLRQLALDEGREFPRAASILNQNFYVDDVLFGADSIESALETREELNQLLSRGGLVLRKWAANTEDLLPDVPKEDHELASDVPLEEIDSIPVLGISWSPNRDAFQFRFAPTPSPRLTKRAILSIIVRLFDPLGWAAPIIITAKIILQELWIRKLEWDAELPVDLAERGRIYYGQLENIKKVSIPRWTGQSVENSAFEIHGFADASTRAYAAVVYLRSLRDFNDLIDTLLIAKTKVAPVSPMSVPRLELCAAVLLARALSKTIEDLGLSDTPVYFWSDSAVTLHWLNKHPSTWQTFIANRVAEINNLVPKAVWRHVPTKENAADCASRGLFPLEAIVHQLWWNGPPWLKKPSVFWPATRVELPNHVPLKEKKGVHVHAVQEIEDRFAQLLEASLSWPRLLRVTAYCRRFVSKAPGMKQQTKPRNMKLCLEPVLLTAREVQDAREFWVKIVQRDCFHPELLTLQ